jgi:hypothetical protein
MILYSLACVGGHEFEGWFANSAAYDKLAKTHAVECPVCGSTDVRKQIMAPAVKDSGAKSERSPEAVAAEMAGKVREHIAKTHDYVGDNFANEARAMYYGDVEHRPVWGEVTPDVAKELHDEGVPAMPLPKPFAPEPPKKRKELN